MATVPDHFSSGRVPRLVLSGELPLLCRSLPRNLLLSQVRKKEREGGQGGCRIPAHSWFLVCANLSCCICPSFRDRLEGKGKGGGGAVKGIRKPHHRAAPRPRSAEQPNSGSQNIPCLHPILFHFVLFTSCLFPPIWLHHIM